MTNKFDASFIYVSLSLPLSDPFTSHKTLVNLAGIIDSIPSPKTLGKWSVEIAQHEENPAQALIEVCKIVHGVLKVQDLSKSIFGSPSHEDQVWEGPMVSSPKFGCHLIQGK